MSTKIAPNKPFVILLYGFPGSGKTAFARQLADELHAAHLQEDRLAHELFGENSGQRAADSRNAMDFITREFLRAGVSVIYDTDVHKLKERRMLRDEVRKAKAIPILLWLQIDPETAFQRTQRRDRRKSDDRYAKEYTPESYETILHQMQNPENEDYIVLSGKHTFPSQRTALFKKMYELDIITPQHINQGVVKPELINLVPQSLGGRPDIPRRNIIIR